MSRNYTEQEKDKLMGWSEKVNEMRKRVAPNKELKNDGFCLNLNKEQQFQFEIKLRERINNLGQDCLNDVLESKGEK